MILMIIPGGVIIFIFAALIFCIKPGRMSKEAKETIKLFYGLNNAHRGLHTPDNKTPENSIPSFIAAREGNYGVELDIQLTKDNYIIVFHDYDLNRVCGIDGLVREKNYIEMSDLKLFDTNEKIPLFEDVLEFLDDTPIIVELKSAGTRNKQLCEAAYKILQERGKNWCIESFDPRVLKWFKKNAPEVLRGQLSGNPREFLGISRFTAFLLGNFLTNFMSRPHFIAYKKENRSLALKLCKLFKAKVFAWTVLPEDNIKKLENNYDAIIFEFYKPLPRYK